MTEDPGWFGWSSEILTRCAESSTLAVNPIIYAEVSIGFDRIEDLDEAIPPDVFERVSLPCGRRRSMLERAFLKYRKHGGRRGSALPDFYIGAHAAISGMTPVTRDARRYRSCFAGVRLIAPERS